MSLNTWSYTQQNLPEPLSATGCVIKLENIFIIGGVTGGKNESINRVKVHIINTKTNEVSLSNDRLVKRMCCSAPIIFENRIYVFGGIPFTTKYFDKWQYIEMSNISTEEQSPSQSQSPSQMTTTDHPTTANHTTRYPTTKKGEITDGFTSTISQATDDYFDNGTLRIIW